MDEIVEKGITDLYSAKQSDVGSKTTNDDYIKFVNQIQRGFKNLTLDLSKLQAGMTLLSRIPKFLRTFKKLKTLNLYGNLIHDEGLTRVFGICMNAQILHLDIGANDLSDGSILTISDIISKSDVKSLQLGVRDQANSQNWITRDGLYTILEVVKRTDKLECFGISGIAGIKQKKTQKYKDFSKFVSQMILNCKNLVSLDISNSGFYPVDQHELCKGLRENKTLKYLNISGNQFQPGESITQAICQNHNLLSLKMSCCGLSEAACDIFSSAFSSKWTLIRLDISGNPIGSRGISFLLSILAKNQHLKELNISNTSCEDSVSLKLESFLLENQVLEELDLSKNSFGNAVSEVLGRTLSSNTVIRKMNLASTRMNDNSLISIAQALTQNTELKSINLADNFFTKAVGYTLLEYLQENWSLHYIDVSANQIDCFALDGLSKVCYRNRNLKTEEMIHGLRKDYIRLSIQTSKIPGAQTKLDAIKNESQQIKDELEKINDNLESIKVNSKSRLTDLAKAIDEIEKMSETQVENIQSTETAQSELVKAHEKECSVLQSDIDVQIQRFQAAEKVANENDEKIAKIKEQNEKECNELEEEYLKIEAMISEIREAMKNQEEFQYYEIPEYPYQNEGKQPVYLDIPVDTVATPHSVLSSKTAKSSKSQKSTRRSQKSAKSAKIVKPDKSK